MLLKAPLKDRNTAANYMLKVRNTAASYVL
jgi:hypothetical protein